MTLDDYDFPLPPEQVAQAPLPERDGSRLLAVERSSGAMHHAHFRDVGRWLRPNDLLVVNDTRVVPARLLGHKRGTGGRAELLLVGPAALGAAHEALQAPVDAVEWVCLGQASKGLKPGQALEFAGGLAAEVLEARGGGEYRVRFQAAAGGSLGALLEEAGKLPLPPYITRAPEAADADRYQTVYAALPGSVAAPTAGLHFTPGLLEQLQAQGVRRAAVTLEVGPGTFLPVRDGDVSQHKMHAERYHVPEATVEAVRAARAAGGRVVAVGTTVVRTLEAATGEDGQLRPGSSATSIFIRPGYAFRQVDALVTNFHLPRSTLLMLVSAFWQREPLLAAYRDAVARGYRFFSYGDAMLLT
jgi:S-adenosylmethionine:tRNA ribosyltransferase-isomerase